MKQAVFMEKYPIFELTLAKDECQFATTAELTAKVEAHPIAKMIGHFDHYAHTKSIDGEINPDANSYNKCNRFIRRVGCRIMAVTTTT